MLQPKPMDQEKWLSLWKKTIAVCRDKGWKVEDLTVLPPASESQIEAIEKKLKVAFPASFREVLSSFSAKVKFGWQTPDDFTFPEGFGEIFAGGCAWDINRLEEFAEDLRDWQQETFSDPDDEYDAVWHNKLAVIAVANGDYIALDLHPDYLGQVVYLSHDDGELHGAVLGSDFQDFISRWSELGCPGPEEWEMSPFCAIAETEEDEVLTGPLDPDGDTAREWKKMFGMS